MGFSADRSFIDYIFTLRSTIPTAIWNSYYYSVPILLIIFDLKLPLLCGSKRVDLYCKRISWNRIPHDVRRVISKIPLPKSNVDRRLSHSFADILPMEVRWESRRISIANHSDRRFSNLLVNTSEAWPAIESDRLWVGSVHGALDIPQTDYANLKKRKRADYHTTECYRILYVETERHRNSLNRRRQIIRTKDLSMDELSQYR